MRKYFCRRLGIAILLTISYVLTYPNLVFAIPPLSDSDAKIVVEAGINIGYLLYAPTGIIKVKMPGTGGPDAENKEFSVNTFKIFQDMEKIGLLSIGGGDADYSSLKYTYNINITDKGNKVKDKIDDKGFYWFRTATLKVNKIVKNVEYKQPLGATNDEFRLIMGIYDFYPTDMGKEWFPLRTKDKIVKQYKFKALVKYDPFQSKYLYVKRDWGYLDKNIFETHNID